MDPGSVNFAKYMSLQIMEIERFRRRLALENQEDVSFDEAVAIWITHGHAERFRSQYAVAAAGQLYVS